MDKLSIAAVEDLSPYMLDRFIAELATIEGDALVYPQMDYANQTYHYMEVFTAAEYVDYIQSGGTWDYTPVQKYRYAVLPSKVLRTGTVHIPKSAQRVLTGIGVDLIPANVDEANVFQSFYISRKQIIKDFEYIPGCSGAYADLGLKLCRVRIDVKRG